MATLDNHIVINARPVRSVNMERDIDGHDLAGYVLTGRSVDTLSRIFSGLKLGNGTRAWSITGPYGCGKSSFALFLDALAGPAMDLRERAGALLAATAPELAESISAYVNKTKGLIIASAVAAMGPLSETVARALGRGARRRWRHNPPSDVREALRAVGEDAKASSIRALAESLSVHAPVLLLIDEFGKSLEYYANADPGGLFLLQELAELFSGQRGLPGGLITLQHLAFESYASALTTAARREWAKVQGRFEDITYLDPPDQVVRLVADSIRQVPATRAMARRLAEWADLASSRAEGLGLLEYVGGMAVVKRCFPIHPVALAALPELCDRYGQYERTLMAFVASGEPGSVVNFCARNPDSAPLATVSLEHVYDYFVNSARTLTGAAAGAARWLEIEARVNEALVDELDLRLLKIVGVLNLVSGNGPLRASPEMVAFAADMSGRRSAEVQQRLEQLCDRGVLVFRSFANEYRLWSGTDFDVSGAISQARELLSSASAAELLREAANRGPVIASRHSQRTGILRYFDVVFADPGATVSRGQSTADGTLVYVTGSGPTPVTNDAWPIVFAFSEHFRAPLAAALELAAIKRVIQEKVAELAHDWVARRELQERAAHASLELSVRFAESFSAQGPGVRFVCGDEPIAPKRGLSDVLSTVCDRTFSASPTVRNEMVARHELTSQGAKARRVLMQSMLDNELSPLLGLDGFGPERAIYHAVLDQPGFHRVRSDGQWRFGPPARSSDWYPAWTALQDFFSLASARPTSVQHLYDRLAAPPIGLREGVMPVLLTVGLLHRRDDIAVYEEGTFQPRLTADLLERLVRNPERFSVKNLGISSVERRFVIERLATELKVDVTPTDKRRNSSVLALMSPLLTTVRNLPPFTQKTKELSGETLAVREALLSAREPDVLLFNDLPVALALDTSRVLAGDLRTVNMYAERLSTALRELQHNWPSLLRRVEEQLRLATATPRSASLRSDLGARARHLVDRVIDSRLRAFLLTAAEEALDDGDWLEAVALTVVDKPVRAWHDQDWPAFVAAATQLGGALRRLEALNYEHIAQGSTEFSARRVTITNPDGTEYSQVLVSRDGEDEAVLRAASRVTEEARRELPLDVIPALVSRVIEMLLLPGEQENREAVIELSQGSASEGLKLHA